MSHRLDRAIDLRQRAIRRLRDPDPTPDPEADAFLASREEWASNVVAWVYVLSAAAVAAGVVGLWWWVLR